jgi:hypothetical protein
MSRTDKMTTKLVMEIIGMPEVDANKAGPYNKIILDQRCLRPA